MNQEELMEKYLDLQETLKAKEAEIESLNNFKTTYEEEKTHYDAEVKRLQEANMNLFLRVSQEPSPATGSDTLEAADSPSQVQSWDSFLADF